MTVQLYYESDLIRLYHGDCLDMFARGSDNAISAIVTDPPYGLEFMGKKWDKLLVKDRHIDYPSCRHSHGPNAYVAGIQAQEWHYRWAVEAIRVLKPGGQALVMGGTRTFHRLGCALEDAGFEIRDCLMWLYGQGFPKSYNVGQSVEKLITTGKARRSDRDLGIGRRYVGQHSEADSETGARVSLTSAAARQWDGWGTALKPAWEPIVLARKPLSEKNVASNVLEHSTGALNIDGCRLIISDNDFSAMKGRSGGHSSYGPNDTNVALGKGLGRPLGEIWKPNRGRWPANVILDEEAAAMLDEQSGETKSTGGRNTGKPVNVYGQYRGLYEAGDPGFGDFGGASRFFYCAKASKKDRMGSKHPTVKPLKLMSWLVRLVMPPDGLLLDPFAGTGTTLIAAAQEGFKCIGCELEEEYCEDAVKRFKEYGV